MNDQERQALVSRIRMQQIRQYYADLAAYYAGDENRFGRMVVDGGKVIPSAYPGGWARHIFNLSKQVVGHDAELAEIHQQLATWGHVLVAEDK